MLGWRMNTHSQICASYASAEFDTALTRMDGRTLCKISCTGYIWCIHFSFSDCFILHNLHCSTVIFWICCRSLSGDFQIFNYSLLYYCSKFQMKTQNYQKKFFLIQTPFAIPNVFSLFVYVNFQQTQQIRKTMKLMTLCSLK